jgi:hypothetical protein
MLSRRKVLIGLSALTLADVRASYAAGPTIAVMKDPNCGCCTGWVEHLREAGFEVVVRDAIDLAKIKARLGVPSDLAACHTAEVSGYVIEGHVPASALRRFLKERPQAKGLAVVGMPVGSPGMEVPNSPDEEYNVILFGPTRRTYARFKGAVELHLPSRNLLAIPPLRLE